MYTTSRIDDQSYDKIQTLYKESFGANHSISMIEKKYNTSMFGLKNVGVFAKDTDNQTAAYYGVFPIVLRYKSKDLIIAQSGDTMTAPNHRKKGLFTKLATETYQLSEEVGVKLVFGFPNKNSFPGFKRKLNWTFFGFMQRFTLISLSLPICEFTYKYSFFKPIYNKIVNRQLSKLSIQPINENLQCFQSSK